VHVTHRVLPLSRWAAGGSGLGGGGIGGELGTGGGDGGARDGAGGLAALGMVNPAGGGGGSPTAGGRPGTNAPDRSVTAADGSLGVGGDGASGGISGGGGGFYGGGGGGAEFQWTAKQLGAGHGGGGSSLGPPGASYRTGVWGSGGDGWVTITYDRERCLLIGLGAAPTPPRHSCPRQGADARAPPCRASPRPP
jgi:hypothetical protein